MKKVKELSTLCGISACAIIYSPYDSNPKVWPSNSGVQRVVSDFWTLPEMYQHKKVVDQETFLIQRIAKASKHLKRQKKNIRELEMTELMFNCLVGNMGMFHLNIMDLDDSDYLIEQYLKDINRRIEILGNVGVEMGEPFNVVTNATPSSKGIRSLAVTASTITQAIIIHDMDSSSSSAIAATFFNSIQHHHHQQQFRHLAAPHVGFYEQTRNLNQNQNHQQWFMEMMNHPEQRSYTVEHMGFSFLGDSHHNCNHNHHHNHHQQEQQIPDDSSTALTTVCSSSIIHVTSPNLAKNILFC